MAASIGRELCRFNPAETEPLREPRLHQPRVRPRDGSLVLPARAKRADRVKLLFWDGSGLVLVTKRLEEGAFKWPPIMDGVMRLSPAQLAALIEGLDWTRVHVPRVLRPQATQ
jgi:transposase